MQIGKHSEETVRKRIEDAGKRWRHRAVVQHKLELAKVIGSIAIRWKLIPGDDTRLEDLLDTAVLEVLQWPRGAHMQRERCKDWKHGPEGITGVSVGDDRPRSATRNGRVVAVSRRKC